REGQHRSGRAWRRLLNGGGAIPDPGGMHWPGDVLDLLLAEIVEGVIEPVAHLIANDPADADPTGIGQSFKPSWEVHPGAEDIVFFDNHVAEVDPNAELYPFGGRGCRVALSHSPLDLHAAADRINHAGELRQEAVAGVLHNPTAALSDLRIDQFAQV